MHIAFTVHEIQDAFDRTLSIVNDNDIRTTPPCPFRTYFQPRQPPPHHPPTRSVPLCSVCDTSCCAGFTCLGWFDEREEGEGGVFTGSVWVSRHCLYVIFISSIFPTRSITKESCWELLGWKEIDTDTSRGRINTLFYPTINPTHLVLPDSMDDLPPHPLHIPLLPNPSFSYYHPPDSFPDTGHRRSLYRRDNTRHDRLTSLLLELGGMGESVSFRHMYLRRRVDCSAPQP